LPVCGSGAIIGGGVRLAHLSQTARKSRANTTPAKAILAHLSHSLARNAPSQICYGFLAAPSQILCGIEIYFY
jgi:hypothetical protein